MKNEPTIFKKLKRKFILTSIITSSAVLIIAFSLIYFIVANASKQPIPRMERIDLTEDVSVYVEEQIKGDRNDRMMVLLYSLLAAGISIEVAIVIISIYFADRSIKPVQDAYAAQKAFIANASHEIKTPLAVIQANLEAADIQGNHFIDNAMKKAEDLAALNSQLLSLARMEAEGAVEEVKLEKVKLHGLAVETADFYIPKMEEKGIRLKVSSSSAQKELNLNRAALTQLLNILVDNAVKYSKSKIWIKTDEKSITVKNDGATISPEDLPHVFQRFYQTDKTKSGVGLGLAIGKKLAEMNGWRLEVDSDKKTTSFRVVI